MPWGAFGLKDVTPTNTTGGLARSSTKGGTWRESIPAYVSMMVRNGNTTVTTYVPLLGGIDRQSETGATTMKERELLGKRHLPEGTGLTLGGVLWLAGGCVLLCVAIMAYVEAILAR